MWGKIYTTCNLSSFFYLLKLTLKLLQFLLTTYVRKYLPLTYCLFNVTVLVNYTLMTDN